MTFYESLKNIFLILLFLQLAPVLVEGIRKQYSKYLEPKTSVALLPIKGILYDSSHYNKHLNKYFKNTNIKAILLKIECPGSASATGQAIFNEILALKKEYPKPIVALVENMCASGGYLIASACDHIVAPGSALIGSIGTSFPYFFQLREFVEQFKIHYAPLKAGTYKTATDPFTDLTAEEKTMLQELLDDSYQQFSEDIARQRKLSINTLNLWADGKIFTARQALKLGLIDELGSAYNVVKVIREKALIEGEIEWIKPMEPTGFFSLFGSQEEDDGSMFSAIVNNFFTFLETRYCGPKLQ